MTQRDLNRSVAKATGEEVNLIESLGFSAHDPALTGFDDDFPVIDWDALEQNRLGTFPDRQQRCAMA